MPPVLRKSHLTVAALWVRLWSPFSSSVPPFIFVLKWNSYNVRCINRFLLVSQNRYKSLLPGKLCRITSVCLRNSTQRPVDFTASQRLGVTDEDILREKGQEPNKNCQSAAAAGQTWMERVALMVCGEEAEPRELRTMQTHISAWQIHCSHHHCALPL